MLSFDNISTNYIETNLFNLYLLRDNILIADKCWVLTVNL